MNFIYIILFVSLSIGSFFLAYTIFTRHQQANTQRSYIENNEFKSKQSTTKGNLFFFYADWCNHCENSRPIWENIKKDNDFHDFNLNFIDVDGDDKKNKELLKHYKIQEYPTIILDQNNKKFIFDANLTTETLKKFLSSVYH
uniref:Thioredoxin domain-containing protein n=1 Tax=viral metagenome TaxID=1070528 RepID=A0A6C0L054_9ZZZZ|tara:strand:- start:1616 stop:2041 length:426 start_codon:yes stop_codon:yes gene_type:complete